MRQPFEPSRSDGRSDKEVVFGLVAEAEPDTVFTYDELIDELGKGLALKPPKHRAYMAVSQANKRLLVDRKKMLRVIRNVGYRMIRADEHHLVAASRKQRAQRQIKTAISVLENTELGELPAAQRSLHQLQLMAIQHVWTAMKTTQKKQAMQEQVINELSDRIGRLESGRDVA